MFKDLIDKILDDSLSWGELFAPLNEWGDYFHQIAEQRNVAELATSQQRTLLTHGLAIDPYSAGTCLKDIIRTTQYIRGIYYAIKDQLSKINDRPVHIVYAGSGPYAPFAMAMTSQFSSDEIQFTIIDIHHESILTVQAIAEELGVTTYFRKFVQQDAVTYQIDDELPIDIAITECLNKGLIKEPQVAISANLVSQMQEHSILIPKNIRIDAYMVDPRIEFSFIESDDGKITFNRKEAAKQRAHIAHILDLSIPVLRELTKVTGGDLNKNINVDLGLKNIPERPKKVNTLMYTTLINTYGDIWINEYQSGLTQPHIENEKALVPESGKINFEYKMCSAPEFNYQIA